MPTLSIDVEARLARFEASIKQMESTVSRAAGIMSSALGGVGVALSGAGIVAFVRSAIDAADELGKLSQRVGVTVESLSELQYAGKLADVSTEQLGDGLRKLAVNLQEARTGSKELQTAFKAVGISQGELADLSADDALRRIADAFAQAGDGAAKTALAVKLFGRSGADLIPLLNQGSFGLRAAADEARKFGLIVTSDAAKAAETFNDNVTRLAESTRSLGIALGNVALPSLTNFTNELLEGIRIFDGFAAALYNIGFAIDPFKSLSENLRKTRQEIAGLQKDLNSTPLGENRARASIETQIDILQKRLEFLKFKERQAIRTGDPSTFDARDRRLQGSSGSLDLSGGKPPKPPKTPDGLTDEERFARQLDDQRLRDLERDLDEAARRRAELEDEKVRLLQEGPALARQQATQLEAFLATTTAGQVRALQERTRQLVQALNVGAITDGEYDSELQKVREQMARLQLEGGDAFENLANDGEAALNRLRASIEGWGDATADAIVQMVKTGKFEFGQLVDQLLSDLLRLTVQQTITRPVFTAIGNALGGLNMFGGGGSGGGGGGTFTGLKFGGAKATGGGVSAGTAYLVGERGPELFIPKAGGQIIPNGGFGGAAPVVVNVYGGTDPALLRAAAYQGAALANSQMGRAARIGAMS